MPLVLRKGEVMAQRTWDKCLRLLVSASLVMSMVPTTALAEALEEPVEDPNAAVVLEGELDAEDVAPAEPVTTDGEDAPTDETTVPSEATTPEEDPATTELPPVEEGEATDETTVPEDLPEADPVDDEEADPAATPEAEDAVPEEAEAVTPKDEPAKVTDTPELAAAAAQYNIADASMFIENYTEVENDYCTFLYNNEPIIPQLRLSMWRDGNYYELTEGTDYTVSIKNNNVLSTDSVLGEVTVTGKGAYYGSQSQSFRIVDSYDLAGYLQNHGAILVLGSTTTSYSAYFEAPSFLATGSAIKPQVQFNYNNGSALKPSSPTDFVFSYADAQGTPVARPVDPGEYQIVLTAVAGGVFTGSATIPFSIVANKSLDGQTATPSSGVEYKTSSEYGQWGMYTFYGVDDISEVTWQLYAPGDFRHVLIEGVDYVVHAEPAGAEEPVGVVDKYLVTFEGIGSYTGTATVYLGEASSYGQPDPPIYVRVASGTADAFGAKRVYVNGKLYMPRVYIDANGALQQPDLTMEGLVEGVDFRFAGFENANGAPITTAADKESVVVVIEGLGTYQGLTRRCDATVWPTEVSDVDNGSSVWMVIKNAFSAFVVNDTAYYMLKGQAPDVSLYVYATSALLREGQGFSVTTSLASDGNSMEVIASSTDPSLMQGSHSRTVQLVDKFDLSLLAKTQICFNGRNGEATSYSYWDEIPAKLSYAGFSYAPTVEFSGYNDNWPGLSYDVSYVKGGSSTSEITGPGIYDVVITGTGDWTGTVTAKLQVYDADEGMSIADCTATLGKAVLVNGVAEPEVTLTYGSHEFVEGTAFTVTYGNNTAPGSKGFAKLTGVSGGPLSGTKVVVFSVPNTGKDLSKGYSLQIADYVQADIANRSPWHSVLEVGATPAVTVLDPYGEPIDASAYDVEYQFNEAPGTAVVTVRGKGEYTGKLSANYTVANFANLTNLVGATVTGANKTYTGKALTTTVTVKLNGKTLKSGTDYTVAYKNNVKAGTATITVTGKGNYTGTAKGTFTIAKASVAKATVSKIANQKHDGKAKTPRPTVKVGGRTLKLNTDYTLTYKNNVKPGTATVTIKGKGNYTGSKNVTFKIVAMAGTWKGSGSKWWYQWKDGTYPKSVFLDISGKTYYFDASGYCVYGWQKIGGKDYYFESSGAMAKNKWVGNYYLKADGTMARNEWVDGGKYHVDKNGKYDKKR